MLEGNPGQGTLAAMFRIKICGITNVEDGLLCAEAGADAIGLNFYAGSRRYVERNIAAKIVAAVPSGVAKVGVFVNESVDEVRRTFDELSLDWIQLHGDESPEYLAQLGRRPVIRALRCTDRGVTPLAEYLAECQTLGHPPDALLIDAYLPGEYGGIGRTLDWKVLKNWTCWVGGVPLVLAGGLTPENLAAVIDAVHPQAVDTASGVELIPGRKDPGRVAKFVKAARAAFAENDRNPNGE